MKTDSIFYKLFKNLPSSFFELINQPEVKLESVPRLLALGLTIEQVAKVLDLSVEQVKQEANKDKK